MKSITMAHTMPMLCVRRENCRRQIAQFTAVAIETSYLRKKPFLVGRISFKCVPPQTPTKKKETRTSVGFLLFENDLPQHNLVATVLAADRQ
ncbi:hypothetical protein AVEN_60999-1 [Araneus ventricosus]|uniref:Uncharacterized protein n=1 Tax=Araneus ventricosus TaxID=182803 RepID=A0A4Y2DBK2_ARAVE|nr:hypothetical protein AVEN_60999-1 [Araneus ventricosus]